MRPVLRRASALLLTAALVGAGLAATAAPSLAVAPTTAPDLVPVESPVSTNPVFAWGAVTGATKYRFQVATDTGFNAVKYDVTTYSRHATPTNELPNGTLYWRVYATDSTGLAGPSSVVEQFDKAALDAPAPASPIDATTLTYPVDPFVLTWGPVTRAKTYRVEIDDNTEFTSPVTATTSNTQFAVTEPSTVGTAQYWRVRAEFGADVTTAYSAPWSFTAQWSAEATPVSPVGGGTVANVELRWSHVAGAKTYEVQISPNGDFDNNVTASQVGVTGTRWAPNSLGTLQPRSYYWRVRAVDTATASNRTAWSAPALFTLDVLDAPQNLAPGVDVDLPTPPPVITEPALSWQGVPRASHYEIHVGDDQNFSPSTYSVCTTFHTTFTPYMSASPSESVPAGGASCNLSLGSERKFWRVRGVDQPAGSGSSFNGAWSPVMSFFFSREAPEVTGPAHGAEVDTPVLSWSPMSNYNHYRVAYREAGTSTSWTEKATYALSYVPAALVVGKTYEWKVTPLDANGQQGTFPAVRTFTLVAPPAAAAPLTVLGPADGSSWVDMPAMTWTNAVTDAEYTVWYRQVGGPAFIALNTTAWKALGYAHTGDPLTPGAYEWYVEGGGTSSALHTFTIQQIDVVNPDGPTNCLVATPCENHHDTPRLSWTPLPYAHHYLVHVATDPDFANELRVYKTFNTTMTFRTALPDNQAGQSYYWFVQPCKSPSRCGPFQDINLSEREWSFRKSTEAAQPLAPADGETVGDDPHLSWTDYFTTNSSGTPGAGAKSYRLQISANSSFSGTLMDDVTVDATTYTPFTKEYPDGTYYWRVQAIDGAGQGLTFAAARTFVKSSAAPAPQSVDGSSPLPTLEWEAQPFVKNYVLEVYAGTQVATAAPVFPAVSPKLSSHTVGVALLPGDYAWRVAKVDPSGNRGPWSATATFSVAVSASELLSPADGASIKGNDLVFDWSTPASSGVASYRFQTSTSATFGTTAESVTTVMTSWSPANKLYPDGVLHYWRVSTLDGAGKVLSTSVTRTFTKDATGPTVVTVSPSSQWGLSDPVTVTFNEPVAGVNTGSLRLDPVGTTSTPVTGTVVVAGDKKSATFTPTGALVPGRNYVLTVKQSVTDVPGNPMAADYTKTLRAALVVDSTSRAITHLWDRDSHSSADGGAFVTSRLAGTSLQYTFTGTSVTVRGKRDNRGGYADVYLDGAKVGTASFYSSATAYKVAVFTKTGLSNSKHVLMLRVLGTKPTASASTYAYPDSFTVGSVVTQENSSAVQTFFKRTAVSSAYGGSYDLELLDASGDTSTKPEFRMAFSGTAISWYATKSASGGKALVYADNALAATVDLYSPSVLSKVKVFTKSGLSTGTVHSIRVVVSGSRHASSTGTLVNVDQLAVT